MDEPASFHPLNKQTIKNNDLFLEWETPEYHHNFKRNNWYWLVSIAAIILATITLLFGNVLLALIILVGLFTLIMYAARPPHIIPISVTAKGIKVRDRLYPFTNIKSFCIKEHWHGHVLILDIDKIAFPITTIMIDEEAIDIDTLHQYIEAFIPEKPHEIPLVEILVERLGF